MPISASSRTLNQRLRACAQSGDLGGIHACLSHGADPASRETGSNHTALMLAAYNGHLDCVVALLNAAPDSISTRDVYCNNALMLATWSGHESVFDCLLPLTDTSLRDSDDYDLLMLAATDPQARNLNLLRRLIPLCDPKRVNNGGRNALVLAAEQGWEQGVLALLPVSDPLTGSGTMYNALNMAVKYSHIPCVHPLLNTLVDLKAQNPERATEVDHLLTDSFSTAVLCRAWPCADILAPHVQDASVHRVFSEVGAEKMPQWAAHLERKALGESLSRPHSLSVACGPQDQQPFDTNSNAESELKSTSDPGSEKTFVALRAKKQAKRRL